MCFQFGGSKLSLLHTATESWLESAVSAFELYDLSSLVWPPKCAPLMGFYAEVILIQLQGKLRLRQAGSQASSVAAADSRKRWSHETVRRYTRTIGVRVAARELNRQRDNAANYIQTSTRLLRNNKIESECDARLSTHSPILHQIICQVEQNPSLK